jgi:hypothetical protein
MGICDSAYRQNLWAELIIDSSTKIPVEMNSIFMKGELYFKGILRFADCVPN